MLSGWRGEKGNFFSPPSFSDFITLNAKKQEGGGGERGKKGKPFLTSPGNPIFRFAVYREYFSNSAVRNAHIQCCLSLSLLDRRSPFSLSILFIFPIFQSGPRTYAPFLFYFACRKCLLYDYGSTHSRYSYMGELRNKVEASRPSQIRIG